MYAIAKALRINSSHDAHLYLPHNANFDNFPENDEPRLRNNYPPWIHKSKDYNLGSALYFWKNNIIRELDKYDLVILSSLAVSISPYLKKCKIFFFATGGDLVLLPFRKIHRTLFYQGKRSNIKPLVYECMQKAGIRNVDKILTQPFSPFVNAIHKLKIPESRIADSYFPIIIDTQKFQHRPLGYQYLNSSIQKQLDRFSFKIFHPSRILFDSHPDLVETGYYKGNDLLIKAFAEFIKKGNIKNAGIYLIERHYRLDHEIAKLKKLIKEYGIEDFVIWLKSETSNGFTRNEMINIYSCCDMVVDEFGAGWFGSICVEGFSCSRPVLSYVDEDAMKKIYKWHPFMSSNTQEGNAAFLAKCYYDKNFLVKQGELGRKWVLEYHSPENAGRLYAKEFERLLKDL
jgi:glycosyltransferase involved in cell wall biosynthesis